MHLRADVNGIRIAYSDEGKGVPLLFVHGFPLSRGAWERQLPALSPSYRVLAPDLRGFGESETLSGPSTMAQFAEDLHALLLQLRTGPVVLLGHSMGGYVALAFSLRFPQMLRGLVLVGTKAGNDGQETAAGRRALAEQVRGEGTQTLIDTLVPKMLAAGNGDPDMAGAVRGFMARSQPEGVSGALLGMAVRPDSTGMLAGISVPTLVVTGAEDVLLPPEESRKLAQAIKGAQLLVIPCAGHLVAFEKAEEFNRALKAWLSLHSFVSERRESCP